MIIVFCNCTRPISGFLSRILFAESHLLQIQPIARHLSVFVPLRLHSLITSISSVCDLLTPRDRNNEYESSKQKPPVSLLDLYKDDISTNLDVDLGCLPSSLDPSTPPTHPLVAALCDYIVEKIPRNSKTVSRVVQFLRGISCFDVLEEQIRARICNNQTHDLVLSFIIDSTSQRTKKLFNSCLNSILDSSVSDDEKMQSILALFTRLVDSDVVNTKPLNINVLRSRQIAKLAQKQHFHELYLCMFNINIQASELSSMISRALRFGTEKDQFIYRTGWLHPKWHHSLVCEFSPNRRLKVLSFLSFNALVFITDKFIYQNDIVNATMYLTMLVSKFEQDFDAKTIHTVSNAKIASIPDMTLTIMRLLAAHSIAFKDPENCVDILRHMIVNKLHVDTNMVISMMNVLRKIGQFHEALMIANTAQLSNDTPGTRYRLSREILCLVKASNPDSATVYIEYAAAMYNGPLYLGSKNKCLDMLNDLGLLGLVYQGEESNRLTNYSQIQLASVQDSLTGLSLTNATLAEIYKVVLLSIRVAKISPHLIHNLYNRYTDIQQLHYAENDKGLFSSDKVLTILITCLGIKKDNSEIILDLESYRIAKCLMNHFNSMYKDTNSSRSRRPFAMLINSALTKHNDFLYAVNLAHYCRTNGIHFKIEHYMPFIIFHYERKEYDHAKAWYDDLVRTCTKSTSPLSKELYRIARNLHWSVNGFVYRKNVIKKNRLAREISQLLETRRSLARDKCLNADPIVKPPQLELSTAKDFGNHLASLIRQSQA